ncbi:restriction endonuclease [Svornostia abyssi]|uniref:Restriction endonuclease n=1 Tax=Svornostia abyssi TaxID=2898438 RepID=A0ABY5PM98_9ACTN|nr:restriction endonuclease [Parviterribacteraceae bacterium J379]
MTPNAHPVHLLGMGQVLRDSRPKDSAPDHIGGYANLYAALHSPGHKHVPFEAGINPIATCKAPDGARVPAILVASSPHKLGLAENPWQDIWDVDNGWVRYYGDNRTPGADPAAKPGNRALITAHSLHAHHDPGDRARATPLILFRRVPREGRAKGFAQFEGLGIVTGVELVTQYSSKAGGTFANYAFELLVVTLASEHEQLDYRWITDRRDAAKPLGSTLRYAPKAWKEWVDSGAVALDRVRRRVSKLLVEPKDQQMPAAGTREATVLAAVYDYYDGKKHRFEALAQRVAERVISPAAGSYVPGGLTRGSGDGGIDFIARLDVGTGFGRAKLIVLGQAKCEKPGNPTHGNHIARTVARLRRGWLGVYVTTSYFSAQTQREVIEDRYPIVLVCGRRLAEEVGGMLVERGDDNVTALLDEIDAQYSAPVAPRDPEELLFR